MSTAAHNMLVADHDIDVRATAYTPSLGSVSGIPVVTGTITVDATSQIRRSATLSIADPAYWPADPLAILSPLGSELFVEYGIVIPGQGTEWVPVIRGVITDVERTRPSTDGGSGAFTVKLADRSVKVAQARFDAPTQTVTSATVVAEIRRLITEVLPTVTVTDYTGSTMVAPVIEIEKERWADGVEKLADAIGAEVFADPLGNFSIRPQPVVTSGPVWAVSVGESGTVISMDEKTTRELTYNRVVASGQRSDGTAPVTATVSDTDPTSPTYIGGAFGVKTRFFVSNLLTTVPQCTTAAEALLARTIGMHGSIALSLITNPALDAGDVVHIHDGEHHADHIVDTVTIPLSPMEAQRLTTRSLELPSEIG
ncbi:MAG TPA: DUF5047 domain-containing protein [Pedococcus sp.]|nr:DUF5047 domain-containing protein [Pedococcus sp.]